MHHHLFTYLKYSTKECKKKTKCEFYVFFSISLSWPIFISMSHTHCLINDWSNSLTRGRREICRSVLDELAVCPVVLQIYTRMGIEAFFIGFHQLVNSAERQPNKARGHEPVLKTSKKLYLKAVIIHTICLHWPWLSVQ